MALPYQIDALNNQEQRHLGSQAGAFNAGIRYRDLSNMQIAKKPGTARDQDGTWSHATLKAEHVALINAGSIAPTRMLANRYGVSVTTIKEVLAENAAENTRNNPPILHCHDPFGRCKSMV